jgi:hypothetical protein
MQQDGCMSMNDPDRDAAASAAFVRLQERREAGTSAPLEASPPPEVPTHETPLIDPRPHMPKEEPPPKFEGKQSAREAADELQRRRSQMAHAAEVGPKGLSAKDAAERLAFSRKLAGAHEMWQRTGMAPQTAGRSFVSRLPPPTRRSNFSTRTAGRPNRFGEQAWRAPHHGL